MGISRCSPRAWQCHPRAVGQALDLVCSPFPRVMPTANSATGQDPLGPGILSQERVGLMRSRVSSVLGS